MRRITRKFNIGNITIGGDSPVTVQSMLSIPSYDIKGNVVQAKALEAAGCEIIRASVPDKNAARLIYELKNSISCPVVADIHFDYKLALESISAGVDKVRINPGNITDELGIKAVADACRNQNIPIRIGVNAGSVRRNILEKFNGPTPEALVESALSEVALLEKYDFHNIVLSLKSSSVVNTYKAYSLISEKCDLPLHIGVTEAGTQRMGIIKSSAGIGGLLLNGIGDTIRVSLTADPVEEVKAGIDILKAVGLRDKGVEIVSCPTCGRTKIDIIGLAQEIEKRLVGLNKNIKVAVMGCAVNGPGEAREADIGVAGGDGEGLIFVKGRIIKKVPQEIIVDELIKEINNLEV